jgi:hypothetical protein
MTEENFEGSDCEVDAREATRREAMVIPARTAAKTLQGLAAAHTQRNSTSYLMETQDFQ